MTNKTNKTNTGLAWEFRMVTIYQTFRHGLCKQCKHGVRKSTFFRTYTAISNQPFSGFRLSKLMTLIPFNKLNILTSICFHANKGVPRKYIWSRSRDTVNLEIFVRILFSRLMSVNRHRLL